MVTRVDKKPIIYNTCLLRAIKPSVVADNKKTLDAILERACGHSIPDVSGREILDDYEDIEHAFKVFGIDDPSYHIYGNISDDDEDETIRFARMCIEKTKTIRQMMRHEGLCESICKIQSAVIEKSERVYFGTEAVYRVFTNILTGQVFEKSLNPNYAQWCTETAKKIILQQSAYMLIHPIALNDLSEGLGRDVNFKVWNAWNLFKKTETMAVRIGSRKNMLAHAWYSGVSRKGFDPSDNPEDDFKLPMTGYALVQPDVSVHMILGLRYITVNKETCVLSHDDCINLSSMAQCYFRAIMYFSISNGYPGGTQDRVAALITDIAAHCCRLIDAKKNFSHIIRSMHILSQGEFNDAFEPEIGTDLGWEERSENYIAESKALDPMGIEFHKRATAIAIDKMDRLNTCFIYHVFIGDEMMIEDLRTKVKEMTKKVRPASPTKWTDFIKFCKAYLLCRFMYVNKKIPRCGGDLSLLNTSWSARNVNGQFTMPPHSDWGKVWIEGEYAYTDYANIWHLEAQDVAYVVKDSNGLVNSKYVADRTVHSELLMAMSHGNILDIKTGSTPRTARDRICGGGEVKEVVITTAPKAENAKPSWKKRVTFAADCEFRKMQAEFDRNCRRVMSFVRGPSLGVDQCILEKQFADIADATATGLNGAICSHDISAWSESMDRCRKFEFEEVLIKMFNKPEMINIKNDWAQINAIISKQGCKDIIKIDNGSFQGFDGSSSTILHSMILLYCIDTARRDKIMSSDVKTNMATLIDDCIALMVNLHKMQEAKDFWAHLKATYLALGFEVDDLKSIFSTIKAIYLSRRFLIGGEVPSDFKVYLKAHSSYEDPLRCTLDVPGDIFGAMRGACDANGDPWFIYFSSCVTSLMEIAHNNNIILQIPPHAAAVYCLAPVVENGWGFPSIISWSTNDVTDKRSHFNAIMENSAIHACQPEKFTAGIDVYPRSVGKAMFAIKSQAWRIVSYSNIFTNPFEAIREGPLKPDMLRRNAVQELLKDVATAKPWSSLLAWNSSSTTQRVREILISSGPLHAPTLSALVNCMPDNYRLSLVGKAIGSTSLLDLLNGSKKVLLKRRISRCSQNYFRYSKAIYDASNDVIQKEDLASLTYIEKTRLEREEFYRANGVIMTDHTFPDPIATFTVTHKATQSVISPNLSGLRIWDKTRNVAHRMNQLISDRGIYVPRRSGRVWEITCDYAKGWDSVSQRVAMGLAILARAKADGHSVEGLQSYFIKSWNEVSNITHEDTHLISIHGSIKRLDANPGSATHPIITHRNILRGFHNNLKSALDAIPSECEKINGCTSHLHDFLAHETATRCLTALMLGAFQYLGRADYTLSYHIATRQGVVVPESEIRMTTGNVVNMIHIEIMDGADNYGLLQACPELVREIAIPTMKSSWVSTINALIDRDSATVERLREEAASTPLNELMHLLASREEMYSPSVILADAPVSRSTYQPGGATRITIAPSSDSSRAVGDMYTTSVRTHSSRFSRALSEHQPAHIMAATCVRSLVWSRLRPLSANSLAKLLFMDPDADPTVLAHCSTEDFWRGVVVEISKFKKHIALSELAMSTFRSLGVPDIHIMHGNDTKTVTHSVASFFGSHLRCIVIMISDLVTSLAGRKDIDFSKPLSEKVVTHNPAVMNAKFRKNHIKKLIETNIETYRDRVEKLKSGEITHRGDKRAAENSSWRRLVEIRCRMYTYMSTEVLDNGQAVVNFATLGEIIHNAAVRVFSKMEFNADIIPKKPETFDDILSFMKDVARLIRSERKRCDTSDEKKDGWDPASGAVGIRMAYDTICMDANLVMNTKFAVSAAEIAPRLHKRIIITEPLTPMGDEPDEEDYDWGGEEGEEDADFVTLADLESGHAMDILQKGITKLQIPYWQALYTLVLTGNYSPSKVNDAIGTGIPDRINPTALRQSHLEDFTDEEIQAAFPDIIGDFMTAGVIFDENWLERDEADAYTTDEMHKVTTGFLM